MFRQFAAGSEKKTAVDVTGHEIAGRLLHSSLPRLIGMILIGAVLVGYLFAVAYKFEFFFFLGLLCVIIFVTGLIRFEAAFLFVPLALMNPYALEETGTNLRLSEVVLLVVFFVWFIRQLVYTGSYSANRRFLGPGLVIVGVAGLSIFAARSPVLAIQQTIRYIEILVLLFLVVTNSCTSAEQIRRIFMFLILGGLVAALIGLDQFITGEGTKAMTRRIFGWFGGGYGSVMASVVFFCLGAILYDRGVALRVLAVATLPFAGLALVLSQTRTWIGAAVVSTIFLLPALGKKIVLRIALLVSSVALVVLLIVLAGGFGLVDERLLQAAVESAFRVQSVPTVDSVIDVSLLLRFSAWVHGLGYFLSSPLIGIGAGNLRFSNHITGALTTSTDTYAFVDNQYLQSFAELGILGGIAWIVYIVTTVRTGSAAFGSAKGSPLGAMAFGMYGGILVLCIGSLLWVFTPDHEVFSLFVLQVALLLNITRLSGQKEDIPKR